MSNETVAAATPPIDRIILTDPLLLHQLDCLKMLNNSSKDDNNNQEAGNI